MVASDNCIAQVLIPPGTFGRWVDLMFYDFLNWDGARRGSGDGAAAWILWIRNMKGAFERISRGGKVLKDTTAMNAEREALRLGVEYLMSLFPVSLL